MLTIDAIGPWIASQVRASTLPDSRPRVDAVERLIDQTWNVARQQPGIQLFDGPMCRLESFNATPQSLDLAFSSTSYRIFFGTNMQHPELADQYGPNILANPLGVSCLLETADDWILLGRRSDSVAYYPDRVHPFAGALEPADNGDVFAAARRELCEELNLKESHLKKMSCLALVRDSRLNQPELIFSARTTRTLRQLEKLMDHTEHRAGHPLAATASTIESAMNQTDLLTPIAIGSLLLWGQERFGQSWFDRHRATITAAPKP
ncbi:MAG: NUDIX hydrolase [Phycisphaerales bacterium]|jgi:8-oxo-dGTP pyrophosphatase MutT (NUDIX family)|nr:NUDIX hydrolase [Phycisphaerales bacterium]